MKSVAKMSFQGIAFLFIPLSLLLSGCSQNTKRISHGSIQDNRKFPDALSIDKFPKTAVVATLENKLPEHKNVVYASAMLLAWNEMRGLLEGPVNSAGTPEDFQLLNNSKSWEKTLKPEEYEVEGKISDGIYTHAVFHKSLPFEPEFEKLEKPLLFSGSKISAFGIHYFNEHRASNIKILYYKNDDQYIIKLSPKDHAHEIILAKGINTTGSFDEILGAMQKKYDSAASDKNDPASSWKYVFNHDDELAIPDFNFNIEAHFKNIEGADFISAGHPHHVFEAYQRTALILDESGAEIESESRVMADSSGPAAKPHPKRLVFDTPFVVLIKRVDNPNPYFMMKVENPELMVKE
jgi:hypothetical protein